MGLVVLQCMTVEVRIYLWVLQLASCNSTQNTWIFCNEFGGQWECPRDSGELSGSG